MLSLSGGQTGLMGQIELTNLAVIINGEINLVNWVSHDTNHR